MKKVVVCIGNYGSGKTEFAINYAMNQSQLGDKTVLIDLDIVNPFFRSAFQKQILAKNGVKLIASKCALEYSDMPVVSAEVNSAFDSHYDLVVFDVGGNETGARALGRYRRQFASLRESLEVLFVVNARRPMSLTVKDICGAIKNIQEAACHNITGIINNTNLGRDTVADLIVEGDKILRKVTEITGIPVKYFTAEEKIIEELARKHNSVCLGVPFTLKICTRPLWLDYKPDFAALQNDYCGDTRETE